MQYANISSVQIGWTRIEVAIVYDSSGGYAYSHTQKLFPFSVPTIDFHGKADPNIACIEIRVLDRFADCETMCENTCMLEMKIYKATVLLIHETRGLAARRRSLNGREGMRSLRGKAIL